ncbi:hypothetical protein JOE62_000819 [Glutamicibacter nicotianae]|nr:hypothetical protein [Glutamicibacter nicotianae]MBM7767406.1 hypothetical protein [Glutamicibacter nicotianae]
MEKKGEADEVLANNKTLKNTARGCNASSKCYVFTK